ncbi:MAG TPA: hypothetical protein P5125_00260 [Kiritimatiellia bacterium]|nr:hypothetical protein [Kiritimatiellia bacterium]HOR96846.1 hypothetical protein [Kiritimatiellia bacterium]HRU18767.1 hypothetical protein [Kiritimatiellia bacterium]
MRRHAWAAAALVIVCGCQHPMENPYFTVTESGLNWVDIRHYRIGNPTQRVWVRLDGNGIVTVREGSSPLVSNPFAKDMTHQQWYDIRETRLTIPRHEAVFLFQTLVDKGLFEKPVKPKNIEEADQIYVSANIQNKTVSYVDPIGDPDLAEQCRLLVMMFHHPKPRARKP